MFVWSKNEPRVRISLPGEGKFVPKQGTAPGSDVVTPPALCGDALAFGKTLVFTIVFPLKAKASWATQ